MTHVCTAPLITRTRSTELYPEHEAQHVHTAVYTREQLYPLHRTRHIRTAGRSNGHQAHTCDLQAASTSSPALIGLSCSSCHLSARAAGGAWHGVYACWARRGGSELHPELPRGRPCHAADVRSTRDQGMVWPGPCRTTGSGERSVRTRVALGSDRPMAAGAISSEMIGRPWRHSRPRRRPCRSPARFGSLCGCGSRSCMFSVLALWPQECFTL